MRRHLTPALFFHTKITAKKAKGAWVYSKDGKKYLDLAAGLATLSTGHSHPTIIKAATKQIQNFVHSGCIFYYDPIIELSKKLASITPGSIDMFFFSNSGAEAVEGAIKLARHYTGRQGVIGFTGGFHGRTYGAATLTTSSVKYRRRYHPLVPSFYHAPYPYCYRCFMGRETNTCSVECFTYFERMLDHLIASDEVACVIIEPVLGEGGYAPAPLKYMKKLAEYCKKHGILIVSDEVQTGFGRTGKWFAIEHYGIKPDIITLGKGIASGFPLSAVGASSRIMGKWPVGAHGTTFGGNPVSCAAALATIGVIEKERLIDNARSLGEYGLKRLLEIKRKHPGTIGDVRGLGLMLGAELITENEKPDHALTMRVVEEAERQGLIIVECGIHKNIIRFMPPLNIKRAEMSLALDIFEAALKKSSRQRK